MEFEDFEGLDSHICAVETAKLGNAEQNCHDAYNVSWHIFVAFPQR